MSPPFEGVDVSLFQKPGKVDWKAARGAGLVFDIVRMSQGTAFRDKHATEHVRMSRGEGFITGGYHFCDWKGAQKSKPEAQAENFADALEEAGLMQPGDLVPWADAELQAYPGKGDTPEERKASSRAAMWADLGENFSKFPARAVVDFLERFHAKLDELLGLGGAAPVSGDYTQASFWRDRMHHKILGTDNGDGVCRNRPLWLAGGVGETLDVWVPDIFQYEVAPRPWYSGTKIDCDVAPRGIERLRLPGAWVRDFGRGPIG